ncbi:MAG: hypothetical protein ACRD12_22945 [Acidimicrobiales bacterium]
MQREGRQRLTAVLLFLLAACSSGPRGELTQGARPAEPAVAEAWRLTAISPIGQPEAAGDVVVVYGPVNQDLYLYGVSVADGTIRWRQLASPSLVVPGIPVTPAVLDGRVAYFRPDPVEPLSARLVVASPDTGADVMVSQPFRFRSRPGRCSDGKDICLMATGGTRGERPLRFSVEAGGLVPDPGAPPIDSRRVGHELLDLGGRQPEILAGFKDGAVRWQTPLSTYFPPEYSTDYGWRFVPFAEAGAHVGSVGRPADHNDASAVVFDLSNQRTVAIRDTDGAPVWQSAGTSVLCDSKIEAYREVADKRLEPWPVRCRYQGTRRYDKATKTTSYQGLAVTIEGFDVATGQTTWSHSLGAAEQLMPAEVNATTVTDPEVLVPSATGPVIIRLDTGATRTPAGGEAFWCAKTGRFTFRESIVFSDGRSSNSWRGGTLLRACAADGSPTTATPRRIARSLGATVADRAVVATERGLVAYDRQGR